MTANNSQPAGPGINKRTSKAVGLGLIVVSIALTLAAAEVGGRLLKVDWTGREAWLKTVPVYYRVPTEPVCEVFFRRAGPDEWEGNVLSVGYEKSHHKPDSVYKNEPEVKITYDRDGFRNPPDLTDWDIVVAGDSFTELGYLPYEDLFTTRLGQLLHLRVKNLGVSFTGPLSQTCYLREFGKGPSTKLAVLVFFEGNDLDDIERENMALQVFHETGQRPNRKINQTSLFMSLADIFRRGAVAITKPRRNAGAFYVADGKELPVTVDYLPPNANDLSPERRAQLESALAGWADTARLLGLSPWLVYMPCKRRVLDGHLKFTNKTDRIFVDWQPTDLPVLVKTLAEQHGMKVIDVTPALAAAAAANSLPFNPMWETHLSRSGSHAVAETIARSLSTAN